jgi:hypothetical protein
MHHRKITLALAAIIAVVAVTATGFVIPQQALAYRHHHSTGIKVDQQINQLNNCTGAPPDDGEDESASQEVEEQEEAVSGSTVCLNTGDNQADISR